MKETFEVVFSFEYCSWVGFVKSFDEKGHLLLTQQYILSKIENPASPQEMIDLLIKRHGCKREEIKVQTS